MREKKAISWKEAKEEAARLREATEVVQNDEDDDENSAAVSDVASSHSPMVTRVSRKFFSCHWRLLRKKMEWQLTYSLLCTF